MTEKLLSKFPKVERNALFISIPENSGIAKLSYNENIKYFAEGVISDGTSSRKQR